MSWNHPNSDLVGDMKRVADAYFNEYLTTDGWRIFTPIPMRQPVWPCIVLFPRWEELKRRIQRRRMSLRWWWEERRGLG